MTPAEQHAAVLAGLDEQIGEIPSYSVRGQTEKLPVLAGRRRIVERHAPESEDKARSFAAHYCDNARCYDNLDEWPCEDYRDAAADLLPDEPAAR